MEAKSAGMLLGMFLTFNKVHETQIWLFFFSMPISDDWNGKCHFGAVRRALIRK